VNQKKGILGLGHTEPCLRWSHLLAFLGLFLFFSFYDFLMSPFCGDRPALADSTASLGNLAFAGATFLPSLVFFFS
jgi:hypothetical protein